MLIRLAAKHDSDSLGLFEAVPRNVIVLPVLFEDRVKAVIELASLSSFTASHLAFLEQLTASIGIVLNSIEATMQTEGLLKQSQQLATELQCSKRSCSRPTSSWRKRRSSSPNRTSRSNARTRKSSKRGAPGREGQGTGADLEVQVRIPGQHVARVAHAAQQHPGARPATQRQPGRQPDAEAGRVLAHDSWRRNGLAEPDHDILDLSKIESGTVSVEAEEVFFASLLDMVERPFRHEAENRHLSFEVHTDPHLARSVVTDSKRLQQVLKNLLSNAFKFTELGGVRLSVSGQERLERGSPDPRQRRVRRGF
jgi:signal transduction histidine kinase